MNIFGYWSFDSLIENSNWLENLSLKLTPLRLQLQFSVSYNGRAYNSKHNITLRHVYLFYFI